MTAYEMVVGLEVHVELKTKTKIFCGCETAFDAPPNTQCCPVCLGLPGALPVLNRAVVTYAARAGLATNCRVANHSRMDRKNYFYPDLPKAYQCSQYDQPLCAEGWLDLHTADGPRRVRITRIHIEEDAGKLLHNGEQGTSIDFNRCGVPLIELVTEPDIRTSAEARAFLQKLRAILLAAGVSDCKMNEGSLRCDVNLSVRRPGDAALGVRTEIKNLNSFAFAVKAIEAEYLRQAQAMDAGEPIVQETRRFDPAAGRTFSMRVKENADDYRYFPDPDLPPIRLTDGEIEALRASLPELPDARALRFQTGFGLRPRDADALCAQPALADLFDRAAPLCPAPATLASLVLGELPRFHGGDGPVPLAPEALARLVGLVADGTIHAGSARRALGWMLETGGGADAAVQALELAQVSDRHALALAVDCALLENPGLAQTFLKGKANAFQAIMGKVMAATKGRANPALAADLLRERLAQMGQEGEGGGK